MKFRDFILLSLLLLVVAACSAGGPAAATPPAGTAGPTALPSLTPAATPAAGKLVVDASQKLGPVNPLVYGTNYGPRFGTVPMGVKPLAVAAKLTYLRFPDGNWGDQNDIDPWQIDSFVILCKELGAQPAISVRLKDGSIEKALELLRYTNQTKGYKVVWWSIGNEPSLYPNYDTAQFNKEWRAYAEAMRAADPSIKLIGPDIHQYTALPAANPKDKDGKDWMEEFLKANGDFIDVVSIHRYPFPLGTNAPPPTIAELRANTLEWDKIIPALRAQIRKAAGRDLPVAVTEVNSSWVGNKGGEATVDSHYNAIWWGDSLGRMIRQGVDIVAQFELLSEYGLLSSYDPVPIYYVYRMYQNFGSVRVLATSDDPQVSIFAARRADGVLTLMLVNLGDQTVEKPLQLLGFKPSGSAETWLFDPAHKAEKQPGQPLGDRVSLPAQSMTLLALAGQ